MLDKWNYSIQYINETIKNKYELQRKIRKSNSQS